MLLLHTVADKNTDRNDEQLKLKLRKKQGSFNEIQGLVFFGSSKIWVTWRIPL